LPTRDYIGTGKTADQHRTMATAPAEEFDARIFGSPPVLAVRSTHLDVGLGVRFVYQGIA
jgi:hypothetical protein